MSAPAEKTKDVLLIGFGAVGAIYSLVLKSSGLARVTSVARSNYTSVNTHGMHFKSKKYGDIPSWKPDRLCDSISSAADQAYSYVFVTTKAVPELLKTSDLLTPLLTAPYCDKYPQPVYVLLQNGLNVEKDLYAAIKKLDKGDPKIVSAAVYIGTNLIESNVVEHSDFDKVSLGMYRPNDYTTTTNTPEESAILDELALMLRSGGTTVNVVPEIQRVKFAKNFWNLSFSSFATLTGYPLPAIFRSPPTDPSASYSPYVAAKTANLITEHTLPTIRATLEELLRLGRAIGFPDTEDGLPSSIVNTTISRTVDMHVKPDSTHKPSMLLDAERGQPIEVEVIVGEVVRMAKERNVDIPRIEMLYALLIVVQNQIIRKLGK